MDDAGYDANAFWRAEIGYGRLNKRLARLLDESVMPIEFKEHFFATRKHVKDKLSESVHSSLLSALFSEVIPSMSRPGIYNRSILGHVSAYSPGLLTLIIEEVDIFGVIFHRLLTRSDPPALLSNVKLVIDTSSLHTAFFTLQELVERYSEMLSLPLEPVREPND